MKRLVKIIGYMLSFIVVLLVTLVIFVLFGVIQEKLFVRKEYLMWIFKYPSSRFVFIYEVYLCWGVLCIFNKGFRKMMKDKITHLKNRFFLKNKKLFMSTFIAANIALLYIIISSVTVITDNKIIDYSFLHPMGREFGYKDVVKIHTGVYGKQLYLPLTHSKGDFFYRIELHNGTKIDLAEVGGVINDEHPYFIIKKIDSQLVSKGICKESSSINFKYITEHLDEVYTEQIRSILQN